MHAELKGHKIVRSGVSNQQPVHIIWKFSVLNFYDENYFTNTREDVFIMSSVSGSNMCSLLADEHSKQCMWISATEIRADIKRWLIKSSASRLTNDWFC
jgi:hypothetical protein